MINININTVLNIRLITVTAVWCAVFLYKINKVKLKW